MPWGLWQLERELLAVQGRELLAVQGLLGLFPGAGAVGSLLIPAAPPALLATLGAPRLQKDFVLHGNSCSKHFGGCTFAQTNPLGSHGCVSYSKMNPADFSFLRERHL